jgi:hypothetical protein
MLMRDYRTAHFLESHDGSARLAGLIVHQLVLAKWRSGVIAAEEDVVQNQDMNGELSPCKL